MYVFFVLRILISFLKVRFRIFKSETYFDDNIYWQHKCREHEQKKHSIQWYCWYQNNIHCREQVFLCNASQKIEIRNKTLVSCDILLLLFCFATFKYYFFFICCFSLRNVFGILVRLDFAASNPKQYGIKRNSHVTAIPPIRLSYFEKSQSIR